MQQAIVTGVSKGLGASIAQKFLESGIHVMGISRSKNTDLDEIAKENKITYQHYAIDLSHLSATEKAFRQISDDIFERNPDIVYLVNNAGIIEPVEQSMNTAGADIGHHMQVNMTMPIVLTNLFLKKATEQDIPLISTAITSGAADNPTFGWSAYCSSKAGINMFTRTAALEQNKSGTRNKVIAFDPGIMDTQMQETIRNTDERAFHDVSRFQTYKERNMLQSTNAVADKLIRILRNTHGIINGKIYDVAD